MLKGFGNKSRKDTSKVDGNSIYQIASQSKMLTGIIVNNLIQEGKLNLEEPITKYLPEITSENHRNTLSRIKLKYLLNHISGIPSDACSLYKERVEGEAWTKGYSKEELIVDINKVELEFEPNSQFEYSNSGYAIVGYICENVSGLKYEQLLKKYVTDKYLLRNTVVNLNSQQKTMLVTPYKKYQSMEETKPSNMGMATPASAVYSNATDLIKLLIQQMKAYQVRDKEAIDDLLVLTKQTSEMRENMQYGFGLIKETNENSIQYGHGGDADGFACEYVFNPEKNTGVVVLTSSGGRWIGELAYGIMDDLN